MPTMPPHIAELIASIREAQEDVQTAETRSHRISAEQVYAARVHWSAPRLIEALEAAFNIEA